MLAYAKYRVILPALERAARRLFDYDLGRIRLDDGSAVPHQNIHHQQLVELQGLVDLLVENPRYAWLYKNRVERMDATVSFFDEARRNFHLARYDFACDYLAGRDVADVASGTGYGAERMALRGKAKTVVGIDIDPQAVEYAGEMHAPAGVRFLCASGDATTLPDASVDVVTSFETIEHVPDDVALLREFRRILRPGGVLVCSTPNNWPVEASPHHVRTYDRQAFETAMSEFFINLKLYNQNSGTHSEFNHDQPAGIWETTAENEHLAECYIGVCRKADS